MPAIDWLSVNPARALRLIRELARAGRYIVISHAQEAMIRSDVSPDDLHKALSQCRVCWFDALRSRWKVLGPDTHGDDVNVIVEIRAAMLVVTLFRGDEE
jgi:hypothetical protein